MSEYMGQRGPLVSRSFRASEVTQIDEESG